MDLWLTEFFFVKNFHPDIFRRRFSGARERNECLPHFSSREAVSQLKTMQFIMP